MAQTSNRETVVGVFLDQSFAQNAVQALQNAGYKAQIVDDSQLNNLSSMIGAEESDIYRSRYNEGNTVVLVNAGNRGEDALNLMLQSGAEYINLHADESGSRGRLQGQSRDANYYNNLDRNQRQYGAYDESRGRANNEDETRVQLREETLSANKRSTEAGQVEVRKTVHEEQREVPVTLRHEEVTLERHAVDRPLEEGEITDMQDEVIRVPIYQEQAELHKQARVSEEVVIGKDVVEEQQTLTGTVRKEDVDIDRAGNVNRTDSDVDVNRRDRDNR